LPHQSGEARVCRKAAGLAVVVGASGDRRGPVDMAVGCAFMRTIAGAGGRAVVRVVREDGAQ